MNKARKAVYQFLKEFNIKHFDVATIKNVLSKLGYLVMEFSRASKDKEMEAILALPELKELVKTKYSFKLEARDQKAVFVLEGLSEKDTLLLLCHELGHVLCDDVKNSNVMNEKAASDFASILLGNNHILSARLFFVRYKVKIAVFSFAFLALSVAGFYVGNYYLQSARAPASQQVSAQQKEVYVTASGQKYHIKNCYYVRNETNVTLLTVEDALRANYEPCSVCIIPED